MHFSNVAFLFWGGVNVPLPFTNDSSLLSFASLKNSFNRKVRQNFKISQICSSVFLLGVGVNFNPFFNSLICPFVKCLPDRFIIFGTDVLLMSTVGRIRLFGIPVPRRILVLGNSCNCFGVDLVPDFDVGATRFVVVVVPTFPYFGGAVCLKKEIPHCLVHIPATDVVFR